MAGHAVETTAPRRREWRVRGQVQGVGFRPCVYRVATALGLTGWVRNDQSGVIIEAVGTPAQFDRFEREILDHLPPLARIDHCEWHDLGPGAPHDALFRIIESDHNGLARAHVTVDSATCDACRRELLDPANRRYRHPLINCTDCGPRYTIVRDTPYDRAATTMASFAMCDACAHEYADPADRRFHAQPNCCHDCGPMLSLRGARGERIEGDPLARAAHLLRDGRVVAIKGLGGFHLACDATSERAVATLRARKKRDHKPFAVMVRDLDAARALAELTAEGERALCSPAAPIVLAPAKPDNGLAPGVAPGVHRVGVMLASTPIHHLLFADGLAPLVMTSANLSDDPLARDDDEAATRLVGIYDAILSHDRPIERAVDDSVVLDTHRGPVMLRRARGYVPSPLPLPIGARYPGLCVGAELKNACAIVSSDRAILGHHVGDLSYTLACERFDRTIDDLCRLFEVDPEWIACDPHPGYISRRYAHRYARRRAIPVIEVQHHHAHLAAVLAEHGHTDPAIGLICDGVGYGLDAEAWGGEILLGDLTSFERRGRMRPLLLPGGDAAAKRTGRCGAAWLFDRFGADASTRPMARWALPESDERDIVFAMLRHGVNAPPSSGMGRLFDAAASLLRLCDFNHHEAMAGQRLESAAARATTRPPADGLVELADQNGLLELDHRPVLDRLLRGMLDREPVEHLAWVFHDALADGLVRAATAVSERTNVRTVALSGGVFCNEVLTDLVADRLDRAGLACLTHRNVPPNDGGLAYGQAAVASARMERER